jgi:hypothetical protein
MLIISLVLAVIGLAALVFAVITSNELVAWVCIGASVLGVVLLILDALQERRRREAGSTAHESSTHDDHHDEETAEYPADDTEAADGSSAHPDSEPADDSVSDDHTNH